VGAVKSGSASTDAEMRRTETKWPAPAKINLFLHVVGRRADGYHELQTAFQLLDLCDTVVIESRADGRIERSAPLEGVAENADLTVRAARALKEASGTALGASIRVRKRIPTGGGLGGGSSDAATTLVALNRIWGCGLTAADLARIGLGLGADVPVFVHGRSAWAEGVGELLTPFELPLRWFLILHPRVSVSTAEVFQAPELTRNSPRLTMRAALESGGGRNDCEAVVRARFPEIDRAFEWLSRWAQPRLTGTGSCLFASFGNAIDAERVAARVPDEWSAMVAKGLSRSPLTEMS
jgi:4-diphosphocytidyl-2-C-methyl-D-erythritol kinase